MDEHKTYALGSATPAELRKALGTLPFQAHNFEVTLTYNGIPSSQAEDYVTHVLARCKIAGVIPFYAACLTENGSGRLYPYKSVNLRPSTDEPQLEGLVSGSRHHIISINVAKSVTGFRTMMAGAIESFLDKGYQIEGARVHSSDPLLEPAEPGEPDAVQANLLVHRQNHDKELRVDLYRGSPETFEKIDAWMKSLR
jgi:hypothetical protein